MKKNKEILLCSIILFTLMAVPGCMKKIIYIEADPCYPMEPIEYKHKPYAEKKCGECHHTPEGPDEGEIEKMALTGKAGELKMPVNDLCLKCHKHISELDATKEHMWLHSPSAFGVCTVCHSPHKGDNNRFLLNDVETLCLQCHSKGFRKETVNHKKLVRCLRCHNAHLGKSRFLLRWDYNERETLDNSVESTTWK